MTANFINGETMTNTALSAHNLDARTFEPGQGSVVLPLPHISYENGFDVSRGYDSFTAGESGFYYICYRVGSEPGGIISSSLHRNGTPLPVLTDAAANAGTRSGAAVIFLNTGDCLRLVITGNGSKIKLREGAGASLNIIKIA
ncbi:MAG: hypothetical protein FWH10_09170 [Oscillospiraceae bacterium]|nr:hypothetical protein [Oscillospiraceae bacterium]